LAHAHHSHCWRFFNESAWREIAGSARSTATLPTAGSGFPADLIAQALFVGWRSFLSIRVIELPQSRHFPL